MSISKEKIKALRQQSQAALKDVKEALEVSGGDIEEAKKYLQQKGLAKAAKKSDRETNEGYITYRQKGDAVTVVGLSCETDFVAKNEDFVRLVDRIASLVEEKVAEGFVGTDAISADIYKQYIEPDLLAGIAALGENIQLRIAAKIVGDSVVYVHQGNTLVSVVTYSGQAEAMNSVVLQVAAMNPTYIDRSEIPSAIIQEQKDLLVQQPDIQEKPEHIQEKMVQGRLEKFFEESVLVDQVSIVDNTKKIKDILSGGTIHNMYRFTI